ncbi:hypothetical protein [Thermoflavimicrobium dichotomicum]|uniref:Uncharacterized protein n=1 Tax=Thermoflavimicrobium dichotomicum TaxID=46223 RepID=A0A1I3UVJ1_9BACL|nr:hypothetical protein [Thermoflavimicrobium dichotomicum]SFJ86763.1 hypothetical protein SAMN05421852_12823 [Thermoflavimicrobium dichotomicum]
MDNKKLESSLDYGLIEPLTIHERSKVPEALTEGCTEQEYDLYFRLKRESPDLLAWSKSCIQLYEKQLQDLDQTNLEDIDKYQILKGWLHVFQVTLENWVKACEGKQEERKNNECD